MNKRITSLLLCFLMVFSMLSTTAEHTHAVSMPTASIQASVATANPGDEVEFTIYIQSPIDITAFVVAVELPEGLTYVSGDVTDGLKSNLGINDGDVDWVESSMQLFIAGIDVMQNIDDSPMAAATFICKVDDDATPGTYELGLTTTIDGIEGQGGVGDANLDPLDPSEFALVGTTIEVVEDTTQSAGKPTASITASAATAKPGDEVEFTIYIQSPMDITAFVVAVELPEGLTYVSGDITDGLKSNLGINDGDVDWVESSMQLFIAGIDVMQNIDESPMAAATFTCKVNDDAAAGTYKIGLTTTIDGIEGQGGVGDANLDPLDPSEFDLVGTTIEVVEDTTQSVGKPTASIKASTETANPGDEVVFTIYIQSPMDITAFVVAVDLPEGLTYVSGDITDGLKSNLGINDGDVDWVESSMQLFIAGIDVMQNIDESPMAAATFTCKVNDDAAPGIYTIDLTTTIDGIEGQGGVGDANLDPLDPSEFDLVGTEIEVAACAHEWTTTLVNDDPEGHYYECTKCGEKKDEEVHSATDDKDCTTADLCSCGYVVTAAGEHAAEADDGDCQTPVGCTKCDQTVVAAKTHVADTDDDDCTTPVLCTNEGCTQEVVPAKPHTEETVPGKAATCEDTGLTDGKKCSVCGMTLVEQEEIAALGHTEGEPSIEDVVDATCTAEGSYCTVIYCTVCDLELSHETTLVDRLPHTEGEAVKENEVAADCDTEGSYDTVVYCSVCNAELSRETTTVDALGHTEGQSVVENEVAADCDTEGSYDTVVYCSVCNAELSRETTTVDALGHTEGQSVVENEVAADCDTAGSYDTVVYCSVCNEELSRETTTVDALGHTEGQPVVENEKPASCGADGSYDEVVYCSVCGEEISRTTITVPSTGEHVYATETERVDATCTEDGYVIKACGCGATEKTTLAATGHTEGEAVKENEVAADCDTEGSYDTVVYCSVCDAELSRETTTVDALGHTEGQPVVENEVAADCDTEGSYDTVVYCSVCNEELSRETTTVDALGHTEGQPVVENEVAADCDTEGSYDTVVYCSVCNEELSRETTTVDALGHTEGQPVVENEVAADCDTAGSYDTVVYCSVCNEELSRETTTVDALGHTKPEASVKENEKPASCGADGSYDEVVYCSVCGEELSRTTITVPSTGEHVYATETERVDATCTEDGYVIKACGCGATEKTTLAATGHTEGEAVKENEVAADCDTEGSYDTVVYCSVCNEELSRETTTVDALGHTEGQPVVENEVAADCDTEGSYDTVVYCSVCDAELSRETITVDALGHTEGQPVVENEVAADCDTAGSYDTVVYCSVCNEELSRETTTVDALGHTEGQPVVENEVAADCDTEGSYDTVVYCSVCNEELSRETTTVDALGHTEGEPVIENEVEPTCENTGSYDTVVYCSVCNAELSRVTTTVDTLDHIEGEDDGDCSTAVTCVNCDYVFVEAKQHDFSGDWHDDKAEGHYHSCGNDGCEATDEIVEHIPGPPPTPANPQVCTECGYVLAEATGLYVNSVEATVTKPVVGKTPDYNVTIKTNPANKAELNRIVWYKVAEEDYTGTGEDVWTTMDADEVFEEGYVYSCDIYLDTVDGYWAAEDVTGKVNGKAHDDSYGGVYNSETELYLAQDFKPIDPSNPQTGDNSNMALWFAMLALSGAGVIGAFVYDRKKKRV